MEQHVLETLINEQLKPYNKKYSEVKDTHQWFMRYTTTKKEQNNFCNWAVKYLVENLNISKKLAEVEVSWFILEWGLALNKEEQKEKQP
tara:strand:- start:1783 stop:2049 length:267 start_codon:yes stop_codon:yes gene_type:complete